MGTWGAESFENDSAMDWVAGLTLRTDMDAVRAALVAASAERYVDADMGGAAVAAAEVVAALRGRPSAGLPDDLAAWLEQQRAHDDPELPALARGALDVVAGDAGRSELRDQWDEAGAESAEEWDARIAELRSRLA